MVLTVRIRVFAAAAKSRHETKPWPPTKWKIIIVSFVCSFSLCCRLYPENSTRFLAAVHLQFECDIFLALKFSHRWFFLLVQIENLYYRSTDTCKPFPHSCASLERCTNSHAVTTWFPDFRFLVTCSVSLPTMQRDEDEWCGRQQWKFLGVESESNIQQLRAKSTLDQLLDQFTGSAIDHPMFAHGPPDVSVYLDGRGLVTCL